MKKIFYGLLISLALVVLVTGMVLADSTCPPTDVPPQPPPTETDVPPTETRLPPPTETSLPPATETSIPPTDVPTPTDAPPEYTSTPYPVGEPTPTGTDIPSVSPTSTPYLVTTETPGTGNHPPTWDCQKEYNPEKCLAPTGLGINLDTQIRIVIAGIAIAGVLLLFVILLARSGRRQD